LALASDYRQTFWFCTAWGDEHPDTKFEVLGSPL